MDYFVNDYQIGFKAENNFVIGLISHLSYEEFRQGDVIIADGEIQPHLYFIK